MKKTLMLLILCGCAGSEPVAAPDGAPAPFVSCKVQVLQTIDSTSTCAVTVTTEVACQPEAEVATAVITAETQPWLDTGEMSQEVPIACGETKRVTFGGMPCYESATGLVSIDDDDVRCDATYVAE